MGRRFASSDSWIAITEAFEQSQPESAGRTSLGRWHSSDPGTDMRPSDNVVVWTFAPAEARLLSLWALGPIGLSAATFLALGGLLERNVAYIAIGLGVFALTLFLGSRVRVSLVGSVLVVRTRFRTTRIPLDAIVRFWCSASRPHGKAPASSCCHISRRPPHSQCSNHCDRHFAGERT